VLSYPLHDPLSSRTLNHVTDLIRCNHTATGSRWRRLDPGHQALLALAHLRNGDTYHRLAAGFGIGTTTAWRYLREVANLLVAVAADLRTADARVGWSVF
jgi:hypothetical protein